MRLVCPTQAWARQYLDICHDRDLPFEPQFNRQAILVANGDILVAGVLVYDTTGPFVFFEHYVTNPACSLRERYVAGDLVAQEILNVCRTMSKLPQMGIRHKGIRRALEKHGLKSTGAVMMTCRVEDLDGPNESV